MQHIFLIFEWLSICSFLSLNAGVNEQMMADNYVRFTSEAQLFHWSSSRKVRIVQPRSPVLGVALD